MTPTVLENADGQRQHKSIKCNIVFSCGVSSKVPTLSNTFKSIKVKASERFVKRQVSVCQTSGSQLQDRGPLWDFWFKNVLIVFHQCSNQQSTGLIWCMSFSI